MSPRMIMCFLVLLSACGTISTTQKRLAVLEFVDQGVGDKEASYFTDLIRGEALKQAPGYSIVTKENLLVLLEANHKTLSQCKQDCEIETGRYIGADVVVSGSVLRLGNEFKVFMKMHATAEARLLSTAEATSPQMEGLNEKVRLACVPLFTSLQISPVVPVAQKTAPLMASPQKDTRRLLGKPLMASPQKDTRRLLGKPCQKSTDCFDPAFCEGGKCLTAYGTQPTGFPCKEDFQCMGGAGRCAEGHCVNHEPLPAACPTGQTLNAFYNPPRCMPRQNLYGPCMVDDDCAEGRCYSELHCCSATW